LNAERRELRASRSDASCVRVFAGAPHSPAPLQDGNVERLRPASSRYRPGANGVAGGQADRGGT
jgi:hypothetical protein